jgi:hypothetical protein
MVSGVAKGIGLTPDVRNHFYPLKLGNEHSLLVEPPVVEEDVVVLMVVFQDLEQGLVSLVTGPRKCMGAQDRGWKPCWCGEKTLGDVWRRHSGSGWVVPAVICRLYILLA